MPQTASTQSRPVALRSLPRSLLTWVFSEFSVQSGVSALMMQNRMMRILPTIFYTSDVHMQLTSAATMQADSVAIIFCNSGRLVFLPLIRSI